MLKNIFIIISLFASVIYANEFINKNSLLLTQEEKEYLKEHTIKYAGDPDWLPFEAFDDSGNYIGIIAEHIDIIEEKLDVKFEKLITKNWLETLEISKEKKVDIISGDRADAILNKNYKPIDTYLENPLVIVTRDKHSYIQNLNNIKDEKIAIIDGYGYSADLFAKYKNIDFEICSSQDIGLIGVSTGKYDAFIGSLALVDYSIVKMGFENLRISGETGVIMDVTLFVDKNKPILYSIINKSIKNIPDNKQHEIISKWRNKGVVHVEVDYKLTIQVLIVFSIIVVIIFLVYYRERKLGKQIKEEKDKFKNIFYKASSGTSILVDGVFTDCNISLAKLLGYESRNEVLNLTPAQLSPLHQPDGQKSLEKSILMMKIAKEYGVNHFEWVHKKADGKEFWVDIMLTNISTKDNETVIHSVWRDIQHRKELQEELIILNTSLEERVEDEVEKNKQQQLILMQQSRLAQMGEMISMIAHQWRQPLNTLSLIVQDMNLKYRIKKLDDAFMDKFSANSSKQITQMSNTIDDFRRFFKPQKEKEVFDVAETINHVRDIIAPMYKKEKVSVDFNIDKFIFINGFPNELGQVLINLINNAKDAMQSHLNTINGTINVYTVLKDEIVHIVVEDSAGGIDKEIIDEIFNPYFSTKLEKNGTGLGLYMSKMIVEGHMQGKLSVQNTDDGAKFTLEFKVVGN